MTSKSPRAQRGHSSGKCKSKPCKMPPHTRRRTITIQQEKEREVTGVSRRGTASHQSTTQGQRPGSRCSHGESRPVLPRQATGAGTGDPAMPRLVRAPRPNVQSGILENRRNVGIARRRVHRQKQGSPKCGACPRQDTREAAPLSSPCPCCVDGS